MPYFNLVCVDTNFFITLYSAQPKEFDKLVKILRKVRMKFVISNYVQREMRWYMRRHIEPHVKIESVDRKKLMEYEANLKKKLGSLPQTPDVSVIFVAEKLKIPIVSSDLKLIETAEKIGLKTFMNSAFAIFLKNQLDEKEDQELVDEIYSKLFAEEVSYSVKGQHVYDPVIRIKKIMDSALEVVKSQHFHELGTTEKTEKPAQNHQITTEYDYQEYEDLRNLTTEIRTDLSDFLDLLEEGQFKDLKVILDSNADSLLDHCTEVRLLGIPETDPVYREAITTLAHLLLLGAAVDLNLQYIGEAEAKVDLLLLLIFEIREAAERLEIEVHLQRIIIFFLTEQLKRLNIYFSPNFMQRCRENNREDVIELLRTFAIVSAVLTNGEAEKTAQAQDLAEIEFIIQLGYQFVSIGKPEKAWLLFEQAIYMIINSKMTGLLYALFEIMLPLHYSSANFSPSLKELFAYTKKNIKGVNLRSYEERLRLNSSFDPSILIKRQKSVNALPPSYQGFLDVLSVEQTTFKNLGRANLIKVIDWETLTLVGIIDPTLTLRENLTVGTSIKIVSGKVRLIEPPKRLKERTGVNLLIVCTKEPRFIVRRAGIISFAKPKEKIASYDL